MSRVLLLPLAVLVVVPLGCGRQAAVEVTQAEVTQAETTVVSAPQSEAVNGLPVAPMPHEPGELDLTNEDFSRRDDLEPALPEIERLDKQPVDAVVTENPLGVPGLTPDDFPPGGQVPPTSSFPGRTGATKSKLIREGGGNAASERAVALGLAWIARQQKADGSWEFDRGSKNNKPAATGFALLCFLGAGETHKPANAKEKEGQKYRKTVTTGLTYLMRMCPPSGANAGRISTNMYEQGIATLALCEAYGLTRDPVLRPYAQAAVNYIQRAQGPNGSWGYNAGSNGDTSIVGWQIQALHAARLSKDLVVDDRVIKKAIKFLDSASAGAKKATYGYADNAGAKPGTSLTASGLWSRCCIDNWGPASPGLKEGVEGLLTRPPTTSRLDLYFLHYATQVLKTSGGEAWQTWNEGPKQVNGTRKGGFRDILVGKQITREGANVGSWDPDSGMIGSNCGRLGTTALCVLNLQVHYRYGAPDKKAAAPNK
jgi:hypothetical protein